MVSRCLVASDDWIQISSPGVPISVYLDEQELDATNNAQVRVVESKNKPSESDFANAKRVYRPKGNTDILQLTPGSEDFSFWARCASDGVNSIIVSDSGIGAIELVDVAIQDRHSAVVEGFFAEELGSTQVVSGGLVDTRKIVVAPGHGFVGFSAAPGECFVYKGLYMGRVLSVSGNELTVDMPFDLTIAPGTIVYRSSTDMLVDGSLTPRVFRFVSGVGIKFDIKGIRIVFRSANAMDYTKFGGATALSAPFVVRKRQSATRHNNIAAVRTNGELELVFNLKTSDRAPAGEYGMLAEYETSNSRGVTLRIDGTKEEELQIVVYADLRTGNSFLRAAAYGHVVVE